MLKKMIAFQKMMLFMSLQCKYNDLSSNNKVKMNLDTVIFLLNFIVLTIFFTFTNMVSLNIAAGMLPFWFFIWRFITHETFLFYLPLKRSFSITGIYLFNAFIFICFGLMLFILFFLSFLFSILGCLISGGHPSPLLDSLVCQVLILTSLFFLLYMNIITFTLFFKNHIIRNIGITVVTALYCLFTYALSSYVLKGENLIQYLKSASNGWQIVGFALLILCVVTVTEVVLSVRIDRYERKHPRFEKITTAQ